MESNGIEPHVPGLNEEVIGPSGENFVCEDCAQIDFQKFFALEPNAVPYGGIVLAHLGARCRPPLASRCVLCTIFCSTIELGDWKIDRDSYDLLVIPLFASFKKISCWIMPVDLRALEQLCLIIKPSVDHWFKGRTDNFLFCFKAHPNPQNMFIPCKVPQQLDISRIKEWIDYCKTNHRKFCSQRTVQPLALKLIDCFSLSVVTASPSDEYIALSYVWGSTRPLKSITNESLRASPETTSSLPNVIRDAMSVTKALGYRYLWVDKFCIDQNNPDEKHDQISQMDLVYQCAEITIIAATENEDFGLPGVNTTPRRVQPSAQVGDITLLSTMKHPHDTIEASKWSSRGWTYQEAVLSRRRLVFTEDQVYFECNAMNCYESLMPNLDMVHVKEKSTMAEFMDGGVFSGSLFPPNDHERSYAPDLKRVRSHIITYSTRQLSFDTDILKAFTGILKSFQRSERSLLHLWGVPFINPHFSEDEQDGSSFIMGLLWRASPAVEPPRRSFVPSWSWASYVNGVSYNLLASPHHEDLSSLLSAVNLEYTEGPVVSKGHLFRNLQQEEMEQFFYPRALHLQGSVLDPRCARFLVYEDRRWKFAGCDAVLSLHGWSEVASVNQMLAQGKWNLLVLGEDLSHIREEWTFFLIIKKSTISASRVGVMKVKASFKDLMTRMSWHEETIRLV